MQTALKIRLLGAFVIIALIVIVVPLFFSGQPTGGSQSISLAIPQTPDQKLQTRTLSVAPPASSDGDVSVTAPPAGSNQLATVNIPSRVPPEVNPGQTGTQSPAQTEAAPDTSASAASNDRKTDVTPPTAAPAPAPAKKTPAPAKKPPATATPGRAANARYSIDLGAYSQKSNAQRLVAKVDKLGYTAHLSSVSIGGIPAARVDVGPFDSRASAEVARLKLHAAVPRAPAKLVSAPTDQHGNAPAKALPANRAGGWAVQVVAYSKKSDATALRNRLRKAGFTSYIDDVKSGGQTLWRVRVGPVAQRDDAASTLARIKSKFSRLGGVVVTVP